MAHELSKRVALVTAASRGLGAATARRPPVPRPRVPVNYFVSHQEATRVLEGIRQSGGEAEAFWADVRDEQEVGRRVGEVQARLGSIAVLVINATGPQPFVKLEDLTWKHCLDQLEF